MTSLIKTRGVEQLSAIEHYRDKIKLDRHALDLAAEEQPGLFLEVAEQHVQAKSRYDQARDNLTRLDAKIAQRVRTAWNEAKDGKATEGKVADIVLTDPEHLTAADAMQKAKEEVDEWDALRSAFDHRLRMIRELTSLYAAGYYSASGSSSAKTGVRDANAAAGREALRRGR